MRSFRSCLSLGILVGVFMTRGGAAQETSPAPENVGPLTPPVLAAQASASYPQQALRERREADVGLELKLDESGAVVDAKVTEPAGHGFDEAALAAARSFRFEPARNAGVAIGATVQFVYEFRLPESPPQTHAPKPDGPPKPLEQAGPQQSTLVLATRPISAASSFSVRDRDFQLRPIASVQDILRVTPGLVVVQHSGGGKANQYFLRGFDADHGTDLALSLDGVPINLVSHAHGQGFSDTNFVIPELVERIEISKGPYFASQGDFATAGAVNLVSREGFEHSSLGLGVSGSPGHGKLGYRGLVIASPKLAWARATFAAELGRSNGPFEHPDRWDRYKLFNKLSIAPTPSSTLSVTELSYSGNWNGSGQIPARAVEQGLVSRFGSLDPDEGGNSARHQLFTQYSVRPNESSELKALAYVGRYRFNLFSNFTLFLHDPEQGDEIEQIDRRTFYGGRLSYRAVHDLGRLRFDTTVGADARNDDIHAELWHTVERRQLTALRSNGIHQSMVGVFVNEELTPARWVRMNLGGRADFLSFAVDSPLASAGSEAPLSGVDAAQQFSPKGSLIVSPLEGLDLFANYGHGFHSNDVRGAFSTPRVNPLTRAVGAEVGARARLFERWDLAATIWQLDLDDETVWAGDEGTTEVSDATRRRGLEFETRYELTPWLAADLDLTFTRSRRRASGGNGAGLALAPKRTWSGGVSARHELGPGVARAGLRFFGIADRPASDDGALVAQGFTQFDAHLGYRQRWFDVALDIENLFDAVFRSAQFATVSRLASEPAPGAEIPSGFGCGSHGRVVAAVGDAPAGQFNGCEDVSYTPAAPLSVRLMGTLYWD